MTNEQLAQIFEALENVKKWAPFYRAVLNKTGSKQQAEDALKYIMKMEEKLEKPKGHWQ